MAVKKHTFEVDGENRDFVSISEHNSIVAGVRKGATAGMIDPDNEDYKKNMSELTNYRHKEWVGSVKKDYLSKFNIADDYSEEVITLAGISKDMDSKDITKKLDGFTKTPKNQIYLKADEQDVQGGIGETKSPAPVQHGSENVRQGGGFWSSFKK